MMAFSDPKKNIDQFGIPEGARVADLGCGSGFYSIAAAKKVGAEGKVYAIDVQKDVLPRLAAEAEAEEIENLEVIWGDIETPGGTQLGDGVVDVVILSNVLFQAENIDVIFTEAHRILRSGGRMLVVEWSDSSGPGPEGIVSERTVRTALEKLGFTVVNNIDAGDHHYGLVCRKPKD